MKEIKGAVFVIISAVIFGCMPLAAKYLYANGCNSTSLVVYRYLLSLPILFVMALWEQRKPAESKKGRASEAKLTAVKRAFRISPFQLFQFFILSLGFTATPLLLFASYNYISSGSATTIHFSYPVFVILASILIFHEKADKTKLAAICFCVLGLVLFYEPGQQNGVQGILLALVSGVTYTFYMMYFDRSELKFIRPFKTNFFLSVFSAVLAILFALATGSFVLLKGTGLLAAFAFSVMVTVVACVLFQIGIASIGAQKSAVLSTFEPITSVIMGVICFHEAVSLKTGIGVVFILAAVLSITLFSKKKD